MLRQLLTATAHPEVVHLFEQALVAMRRQGAEIVDPVRIPEHDEIPVPARFCVRLKFDLNAYLVSLGPQTPMKSLEEVIASQKIHPSIEKRMLDAQAEPPLANECATNCPARPLQSWGWPAEGV